MANAVRRPWAMAASALPVSLSAVMLKSTNATAIIGTITMIMKNSNRRLRKLIFLVRKVPLKVLCPSRMTFRLRLFVDALQRTVQRLKHVQGAGDSLFPRYHRGVRPAGL